MAKFIHHPHIGGPLDQEEADSLAAFLRKKRCIRQHPWAFQTFDPWWPRNRWPDWLAIWDWHPTDRLKVAWVDRDYQPLDHDMLRAEFKKAVEECLGFTPDDKDLTFLLRGRQWRQHWAFALMLHEPIKNPIRLFMDQCLILDPEESASLKDIREARNRWEYRGALPAAALVRAFREGRFQQMAVK